MRAKSKSKRRSVVTKKKAVPVRATSKRRRAVSARADLDAVTEKYIGETEKNLAKVFASADRAGGVLLIDEADALFGKRSEVKDSHDRYANLETALFRKTKRKKKDD